MGQVNSPSQSAGRNLGTVTVPEPKSGAWVALRVRQWRKMEEREEVTASQAGPLWNRTMYFA
jgi:hypothetical protein